jgi:hypothetical protein
VVGQGVEPSPSADRSGLESPLGLVRSVTTYALLCLTDPGRMLESNQPPQVPLGDQTFGCARRQVADVVEDFGVEQQQIQELRDACTR